MIGEHYRSDQIIALLETHDRCSIQQLLRSLLFTAVNWMAWCKTSISDDFKPCKDFSLQTAFAGFKFVFKKMTQES